MENGANRVPFLFKVQETGCAFLSGQYEKWAHYKLRSTGDQHVNSVRFSQPSPAKTMSKAAHDCQNGDLAVAELSGTGQHGPSALNVLRHAVSRSALEPLPASTRQVGGKNAAKVLQL